MAVAVKTHSIAIRVTAQEREQLKANAQRFDCGGNVAKYLRMCGTKALGLVGIQRLQGLSRQLEYALDRDAFLAHLDDWLNCARPPSSASSERRTTQMRIEVSLADYDRFRRSALRLGYDGPRRSGEVAAFLRARGLSPLGPHADGNLIAMRAYVAALDDGRLDEISREELSAWAERLVPWRLRIRGAL